MKFRKLIFGLAATPLLLVSCNNAMSFEDAKAWVAKHYNETVPRNTLITFGWDYHATTNNDVAMNVVREVFEALKAQTKLETDVDLKNVVYFPGNNRTIGEEERIDPDCIKKMPPLTSANFVHYGKQEIDEDKKPIDSWKETFKVFNNSLTVTYTNDLSVVTGGPAISDVSFVRTYDSEGYITGCGLKISKYNPIKDDYKTVVKLKITLGFRYTK